MLKFGASINPEEVSTVQDGVNIINLLKKERTPRGQTSDYRRVSSLLLRITQIYAKSVDDTFQEVLSLHYKLSWNSGQRKQDIISSVESIKRPCRKVKIFPTKKGIDDIHDEEKGVHFFKPVELSMLPGK